MNLKYIHDYHFVGKVGSFCPIKPGAGGGQLLREKDGKYYSATGAKGYRWMESEVVKNLHKEKDIDKSYFIKLAETAKEDISKFGDFEWFVSDEDYPTEEVELPDWFYEDELPWYSDEELEKMKGEK